jgi:hypothetical protein
MPRVRKIETTHYVYEYTLTDEEHQLFLENEDAFWDQFDEDNWGDPYMDVDSTPTETEFIDY